MAFQLWNKAKARIGRLYLPAGGLYIAGTQVTATAANLNAGTGAKASAAEINTGTEDTKFTTAKGIADSNIIKGLAAGVKMNASATPLALDGSNPTSFAYGLTTCTAVFVQLVGSAAPGDSSM